MGEMDWYFLMPNDSPDAMATSWQTVNFAKRGDDIGREARNKLLKRFHESIFKAFVRALGPGDAVAELVQEFIAEKILDPKFYTNLDREKGGFRKYLWQSIRNAIATAHTRDPRLREVSIDNLEIPDQEPSLDETFEADMTIERVRDAWKQAKNNLSPTAGKIFEYWYFPSDESEVKSLKEAAAILGIPYPTAKAAFRAAQDSMRMNYLLLLREEAVSRDQAEEEIASTIRVMDGGVKQDGSPPKAD